MRTYVFDARVIQDHFPGIGRCALNLLRALPAHLQPNERIVALHDPTAKNTRLPFDPASGAWSAALSFVEYRQPVFTPGNLLRPLPVDGDATHHQYYVRPLRAPGRSITTIYDAISFVYPELVPSARARILIKLFHRLAIGASDTVLTISQSAADDLARTFPAVRSKLRVIPLAADAAFTPKSDAEQRAIRARFGIAGRFAFYIASNKPHKNLPRLIEAWGAAQPLDAQLVVAGHQDPRYPEARQRATALGLDQRVTFIGSIDDAAAAALHSACDAFVYPSLYEGFGLTPLEAMSCGAPVVCSNSSSLPEVVGDAAVQFDPTQPGEIAAALRRVLEDAGLRGELRAKSLMQAKRFSWARAAAATIDAYRGHEHRTHL